MSKKRPLKIAIMGTRGIPANYGGFETFAEELSVRLAERGHQVSVYCRHAFGSSKTAPSSYRGVELISVPAVMHKYLETPTHALFSFLDLLRRDFDVVLLCNAANSPFSFIARLSGIPLIVNVDGIERLRSKWNSMGRLWYRIGERCSVWFASKIVADAKIIARYYKERYGQQTEIIAYGAAPQMLPPGKTLTEFGLVPRRFVLYVSRLEPENNALGVIQAYSRLHSDIPLVIVGDAPYARDYIDSLKQAAGPNVIFTGFQFGEAYRELRSNCLLYIQATEVGGTHPALVEAMAYGNCVVANGVPEHYEVLGGAGCYYWKNDFQQLSEVLAALLQRPAAVESFGRLAADRAGRLYCWEKIVEQYEVLILKLLDDSSTLD